MVVVVGVGHREFIQRLTQLCFFFSLWVCHFPTGSKLAQDYCKYGIQSIVTEGAEQTLQRSRSSMIRVSIVCCFICITIFIQL